MLVIYNLKFDIDSKSQVNIYYYYLIYIQKIEITESAKIINLNEESSFYEKLRAT